MKIRAGFVTNSSSSSFIIGKRNEHTTTVEDVYQIVRDLYIKYLSLVENTITYMDEHSDCPFTYTNKDGFISFKEKENALPKDWKQRERIRDTYTKIFRFDFYYSYFKKQDWLDCETYKDYEEFWMNKIQNKEKFVEAPFTICDLRDKNAIVSLMNSKYDRNFEKMKEYKPCIEKQDLSFNSELFGWYYPYVK